ncbi:hypothetical protein BT96DRAFT_981099 [Gymnopus androsaceus JB14]|uniref:G-protein coupled receptors family 1 profile domain-containing protein n=1 Tax=Gymnopus androsaceus JB14 TaxID=1447944 RepID=A0A6A4GRK9_9AGAR|nr:hypothetical protein BT96DRAFT_981099 [Gymnopus androsaceus JB14]
MLSEESEQLAAVGTVLLQNISALMFEIGLLGVYTLAFIISMHTILQKENNGRAHKALIVLLLAGFVMVVLYTCANIAANFFLVNSGLVVSLTGGLMAQEMAADLKVSVMIITQEWSGDFMVLIADMAIVWRAWALWSENRLIKWTLLIILLTDIGVNIADVIADIRIDISTNGKCNRTVTLDWLGALLNLIVNIVATLLIAHRAWTHHQSTRGISRNKKTQVEAILQLMVDSGAIFGVVQVIFIIFNALDIQAASLSPVYDARVLLEGFYVFSAALNPVALVILIQTENTYEHSFCLEDVPSLEIISVPNVN